MADEPINRRRFFREGLRELLKPLSQAFEPLEQAVHQLAKFDEIDNPPPPAKAGPSPLPPTVWLRPPGALPEEDFRTACTRCGDCVKACPVKAIQLDPHNRIGGGLPYIDAEVTPCTLCEGLNCMLSCPTGALLYVSREEIDMGTAEWRMYECLRTSGSDCRICVDQCPMGAAAIEIPETDEREVIVHEAGCTGCGVCQQQCPTTPKAIVVIPRN
jgi:ferredoxin-type protein NapG